MDILDVVNALRHHCSTVWEYNRTTHKVFVHHDVYWKNLQGKEFDVDELADFYKKNCLFEGDYAVWDRHLRSDALERCFDKDFYDTTFTLRFSYAGREPQWYKCVAQKFDDNHLLMFDRDIYDRVKEVSFQNNVENFFGNVLYIDVETGQYLSHKGVPPVFQSCKSKMYDTMITRFSEKFVTHPDTAAADMSIDHVRTMLKKSRDYTLYLTVRGSDGRIAYTRAMYTYLDSSEKVIVLAYADVSNIVSVYEKQLQQYRQSSRLDALTGVYNRNYYEEKVKSEMPSAGVAVLDIDEFKLCNDIFGHPGGDAALINVVSRIRESMREQDLLIRFGGDEFLLILKSVDADSFEARLTEIRDRVHASDVPGYSEMALSVSIGGVLLQKNETVESGVARADALMYRAKDEKNTVITEKNALLQGERNGFRYGDETVKNPILIVDDSELNREILSAMLSDHFQILTAADGEECINMLRRYKNSLSVILLDIVMPGMNGFDVLAYMNRHGILDEVPVIMISGDNSEGFVRRAYDMGVSDYISRPFDAKIVYQRVYNIVKLHFRQRMLVSFVAKQAQEKERNSRTLIGILSQVLEFRNGENGRHVRNVRKVTELLLERLIAKTDAYRLTWQDRAVIATASVLHDIGKTAIDEAILNKPGKLSEEEYKLVKNHTVLGAMMLSKIQDSENEKLFQTAVEVCRWHHERYDGKGYPDGLSGEKIPISAQVVSLADVYDALISRRAYKEPLDHTSAVKMILNGECGAFNPILLECLADTKEKIRTEVFECSNENT